MGRVLRIRLHAASKDRTADRNHALDVATRKLFSTIDSEQTEKSKIFTYIKFTRQVPTWWDLRQSNSVELLNSLATNW